jgi:pSer/pThr/pTyr-binding forkhead associated (FHA) protein
VLLSTPAVVFHSDDDLAVGEFGIATRMVQRAPAAGRERRPPPAEPEAAAGATMVYKPRASGGPTEAVSAEELGVAPETVTLTVGSDRHEIDKRRVVLGRSKDCDIQLNDPNVSRRHAEVRQEGTAYWVVDLDSTNGVELNGEKTARARLEPGDRIVLGSTEIVFDRTVQE